MAQLEQYQKATEIFEQVGTLPLGLLEKNYVRGIEYKLIKAITFFKKKVLLRFIIAIKRNENKD